MEVIEKLKTTTLEEDDWVYMEKNEEYYEGVARYQAGVWREAREETMREARIEVEALIQAMKQKAEQDKVKAEQDKVKAEQDKVKAEQDKVEAEQDKVKAEQDKLKAEQEIVAQQMRSIRKFLKRGDSLEEIADFMEMDMPILMLFVEQIKAEDAAE